MKILIFLIASAFSLAQTVVTDTVISPIGQVAGVANIVYPQGHTEGPSVVKLEHGPYNFDGTALKQLPLTLPDTVVGQTSSGTTLTALTMWVGTSHGVQVNQYNLSANPVTQTQSYTLGTANSIPSGIIQLSSGAIVVAWYENASTIDGHIDFRFGFLKNGTWDILNVSAPQSTPSALKVRMGIAQHPDGTIWSVFKHDSFPEIGAIHLQEGASSLSLLSVNSTFITQSTDGLNGPNSEFPFLALAPDPSTNSLLLAYQRNEEHIFQTSPFLKGATVAVCRINSDGTHPFISVLNRWVERVSNFALSITGSVIQIVFPVIDENALNVNSMVLGTLNGSWNYTAFLTGNIANTPNQSWFTNRTDRVELVIGTTDGQLHKTVATNPVPSSGQWLNGFFVGNNGTLSIPNIPWSKYTAIVHFAAFAGVNGSNVGNGTVNMSNIPDTAALIAARPAGKKVLLCLKDNDSFHSAFGQSAASGTRATFVTNITNAVTSNGYDGVELDWEASVNTSDYIAFIAALRAAMPTKIIAMDAGDFSGLQTVANGAQANLDEVNVMCYDMDGASLPNNGECAGSNCTWFNDSLFQAGDAFKNTCAQRTGVITGAGVAASKIGIGIPYYGRRWAGAQQPQQLGTFATSTVLYRNLVTDGTRWQSQYQQYDSTHIGQYLSIPGLNEFDSYTGAQQIGDIVSWARSQGFGGLFSFTLDYEYLASNAGDARYPLSTALYADVFNAPFPVNTLGIIQTGLPPAQDNLLGPLIPYGASPWVFGDLAQKGVADNMAPAALAQAPALSTALLGTVSWTQGTNVINTTADLRSPLSGQTWVALAWNSVDGTGTGRALCPIAMVTVNQITCQENMNEPSSSGVTAYKLPPPVVLDGVNISFESWTTENPSTTWNYYDVAIGLYRLYYRTGNSAYLTYARAYTDIMWQWTLDHGYRRVAPRASGMLSQFFRTFEGHPERLPGLYNWINMVQGSWVPTFCPYCDNREAGYMTWNIALGAKVDTDPTRHAQYCSWLTTYTTKWNQVQAPDGSWPENEYALNASYASAPKTFVAPFLFQGAPWREAINVKAMEAAYESLNDTSLQGCNKPALAATTLTTITNAVTWQNNYGRDSVNRGIYYEVNSQSDDQDTVNGAGSVSINIGSTSLVGSGTNWISAGYCDGTHFVGIQNPNDPRTVYKIASCITNTAATLSNAFGLYGETLNVTASPYQIAPAAFTGCHSSATYCFGSAGDRNLTRTVAGDIAWLYSVTLNPTYKAWADEFTSAQLGGPTAGLTSAANIGLMTLPCSGPACDGYVADTVTAAPNCAETVPVNTSPCVYGGSLYGNLGKNFGEAFGAPGIDNALAWRLYATPAVGGTKIGGKGTHGGKSKH